MATKHQSIGAASPVDAVTFLEGQHRDVEQLFAALEGAGDPAARTDLFLELAGKVEAHAQIEEQIMYPAGRAVDEAQTKASLEDHRMVRDMLAKINETDAADDDFMMHVTELKELIEHHVETEEAAYFPEIRQSLGDARLEELGQQLDELFARIQTDVEDEFPVAFAAKRRPSEAEPARPGQ